MQKIFSIKLNNTNEIMIVYVPELKQKFNYYYSPQKKLHRFDEVTVKYESGMKKIILMKDMIQEILYRISGTLELAFKNELQMPPNIEIGNLGKQYNIDLYNGQTKVDYKNCGIFFYNNVKTWIYQFEDAIYLEIGPIYEWIYNDPKENDEVVPFDEFIKQYKPFVITHIDRVVLENLKKESDNLLKKIDISEVHE